MVLSSRQQRTPLQPIAFEMEFVDELTKVAVDHSTLSHLGAFYGPAANLAPGAGLIMSGVAYPEFNETEQRFQVLRGDVLILTHECDIDPENSREFNTGFVCVPLIDMSLFAQNFAAAERKDLARNLARDIAADRVNRMFFLPPPNEILHSVGIQHGAFVYLNAITSSHVRLLKDPAVKPLCALSEYALDVLDAKLKNHFMRPKSERLAKLG